MSVLSARTATAGCSKAAHKMVRISRRTTARSKKKNAGPRGSSLVSSSWSSSSSSSSSSLDITRTKIHFRGRRGVMEERNGNNTQKTKAVEDVSPPTDVVDVTYPIALFLGVGVGFAVARLIVYLRLQYIAAKFFDLRIFQQDARVLEYDCGNSGRNLYYYPKNVKFVTYKGPEVKGDLLGQISVQADIPVQIETAAYEKTLTGMRDESIDAVVSTGAFTRMLKEKGNLSEVLAESARILKSDGQAAMIFIEPKSDELVNILKNNSTRQMFNPIEVDEKWETLPLFPYLIGTMTKKERVNRSGEGEKPKSELQSIRSRRKPKK